MKTTDTYLDLRGRTISLDDLDKAERALITSLIKMAAKKASWNEFENEWLARVDSFYANRGLSRSAIMKTTAYRIGSDLAARMGIAEGNAAPPDYRDDLKELIDSKFRTRRAFCKATGLSEDMLSHVLSRRKDLSIETLTSALGRVGYALHIAPKDEVRAQ